MIAIIVQEKYALQGPKDALGCFRLFHVTVRVKITAVYILNEHSHYIICERCRSRLQTWDSGDT